MQSNLILIVASLIRVCSDYRHVTDRDSALVKGWYRLNSSAGSKMPNCCVTQLMCNTHAPGWLNVTLPPRRVPSIELFAFTRAGTAVTNSLIMVRNYMDLTSA